MSMTTVWQDGDEDKEQKSEPPVVILGQRNGQNSEGGGCRQGQRKCCLLK